MYHWSMKHNPVTIDNKLAIIIFIKNLYNKDIKWRVPGAKNVNTLLDAFKTQWSLLKLKKYKSLVSEDDSIHSIHIVNQISDISKSSGHFSHPRNVNQAMPPVQDEHSSPTSPWYSNNQHQNYYQCATPYFGTCYVCGIFGHLGKKCPNWVNNHQNAPSYLQSLLPITLPPMLGSTIPQTWVPRYSLQIDHQC